jgi:hypothetical protein
MMIGPGVAISCSSEVREKSVGENFRHDVRIGGTRSWAGRLTFAEFVDFSGGDLLHDLGRQ